MLCNRHVTGATILFCSLFAFACSKQQNLNLDQDNFGFFKSSEAREACLSANLSQWELTGAFLHKLLRCASNRSEDGGETLPATQQLLSELRPDQMQRVINFLLLTDPKGSTHEERYPYLVAFTTLLDRGLTAGEAQGLNLSGERLVDLQSFLLSFNPARTQKLLTHWSQSGRLDRLMADLGRFLEGLEDDNLEALTHELLAGRTLRSEFLAISRELLEDEALMAAIERSLEGQATLIYTPEQAERVRTEWRQPMAPDEALQDPAPDTNTLGPTPAQRLQSVAQDLGPEDVHKLSRMLLSLWEAFRGLSPEAQQSLQDRLTQGLEGTLDQHGSPSRWFLAVLQDLQALKASDLNTLTAAFKRLVTEDNDPTLDTLRAKIGANRLMDQTSELLLRGGPVPGCSSLTIEGLARGGSHETDAYGLWYNTLRVLTEANTACEGRAPLLAALENWSGVTISDDCNGATSDRLCVQKRSRSDELIRSYWSSPYQEAPIEQILRLVESSLAELRHQSTLDPYTLKNYGLAHVRFEASGIDAIWKKIRAAAPKNIHELANLDLALARDPDFRGRLAPDFLEIMLASKVEKLGSIASQFQDLVPETESEQRDETLNKRAMRTLAGLYTGGPFEEALRTKTSLNQVLRSKQPENTALAEFFQHNPASLSWFLFRHHQADSIFRSPEFAALGNEDILPFVSLGNWLTDFTSFDELQDPGDPRYDVRFTTLSRSDVIQPLQAIRSFDPTAPASNSAWGLWQQQLSSSALVSKDVPPALSKDFEQWSGVTWTNDVSSPETWRDLIQTQEPNWAREALRLNREFFDVQDYTPEEARILTLYYVRHYLKWPFLLPKDRVLRSDPLPLATSSSYQAPVRGFFNTSFLISKAGYDFPLYSRMVPDALRAGTTTSLEVLQKSALPSFADYTAQDGFFPITKQRRATSLSQLKLDTSNPSLRLFSTFNLMTYTRQGQDYLPQPLVGFGNKVCQSNDATKTSCPVEIQAATDEEAYQKYQTYVSEVLAHHFCPLLAGEVLGRPVEWQRRLGLKIEDAKTCDGLRLVTELSEDPLRFPLWLSQHILDDVFTMGRVAHLKPSLAQIPSALRYYKLKATDLSLEQRASRWLRESRGIWHHANAASQSRRQFFAVQFWAGAPSILNSYFDAVQQSLDKDSWKQTLIQAYQREEQNPQEDMLRALLNRFIREQERLAAQDGTLLELALTLLQRLQEYPSERLLLARLLADYRQLETYEFLGKDLPFAIFGLFEGQFDWQNPGIRFSKFLGQRETLQAWAIWAGLFPAGDWDEFLAHLAEAWKELGPLEEQVRLTRTLSQEGVRLGSLWQAQYQQVLAESWDDILLRWRRADYSAEFEAAWMRVLKFWGAPLKLFDGRTGPSAQTLLENWLPLLLGRAPQLIVAHQETGGIQELLFWPRLFRDALTSFEQEPLGSLALSRFLASPELDFANGQRWQRILVEEEARSIASQALTTLSNVKESLWQAVMIEATDLVGRLQKPLAFLQRRIVWQEDPDHNAYRRALDHLYGLSDDPDLRQKQIEVLTLWLRDEEAAVSSAP